MDTHRSGTVVELQAQGNTTGKGCQASYAFNRKLAVFWIHCCCKPVRAKCGLCAQYIPAAISAIGYTWMEMVAALGAWARVGAAQSARTEISRETPTTFILT
jgi:hypothetical protein